MGVRKQFVLASVGALGLLGTACGTTGGSPSASHSGAPYSATMSWGKFTLSSAIANKIDKKQALNFVLSFQTLATVGAPVNLLAGMRQAAANVKSQYGVDVNVKLIGPPNTDPVAQISQVQQAINAGQVDCLAVEPVTPDAFVRVLNQAVDGGIPAYTVNTDSPGSHRFSYSGANDSFPPAGQYQMGNVAGDYSVQWLKDHSVTPKVAALVTGDTTAPWAQGRMQGWMDTMKKAYPNLQFVGTPTNALTTGYDPAGIYSQVAAFMNGHPNVDLYFDSDWGAKTIGKLIKDRGLKGKINTIGYNVDTTYLDEVSSSDVMATVDQRFDEQSAGFVTGCAAFLLKGTLPPGQFTYIQPTVVTASNVQAVKDRLAKEIQLGA
jgi:ABC-type sugar transport system substrate-binding protein